MLRASSQGEGFDANLQAVVQADLDSGTKNSQLLRQLTECTIEMRWDDLAEYREEAVKQLRAQGAVDALAVASGFNGITRVADATGIPIDHYEDELGRQIRQSTGIDAFDYEAKSARYG